MKNKFNKTIFQVVRKLLSDKDNCKDNDVILSWYVYEEYSSKWANPLVEQMTVREFFHKLYEGKIPSFSTISRARRAIQKEYPSLRGDLYEARHKSQNEVVKAVHRASYFKQLGREEELWQ